MPADLNRVRNLFLAVTDLPAADRSAYLAVACGSLARLSPSSGPSPSS